MKKNKETKPKDILDILEEAVEQFILEIEADNYEMDSEFLLPAYLIREFEYQGTEYFFIIRSTMMCNWNRQTYSSYYPGKRELLVQKTLLEMLSNPSPGFVYENGSLWFSLEALNHEVKKASSKDISYGDLEIKQALHILAFTQFQIIGNYRELIFGFLDHLVTTVRDDKYFYGAGVKKKQDELRESIPQ